MGSKRSPAARPAKAPKATGAVGPEGRQADRLGRLAPRLSEDRRADQAADLALVGRHIVGGVALGVFDMAEALAMREANVVRRDVVLEVDEALAASSHFPQRLEGESRGLVLRQGQIGVSGKAREARGLASGGEAVAGGGANAADATRRSGRTLRLNRRTGDRRGKLSAPCRLRAGLAREIDVGIPAARDAQEVGLDRLHVSAALARADLDAAPVEAFDLAGEAHIDAGRVRTLRAGVDHDNPLEPR